MLYITRRESFCAAHRLSDDHWTKEKNQEVFGECSNVNWHGHNYELFVTVKGDIHPDTGFVVNLKTLSKIIREHVIKKLDHKNLNLDVPFLQGKITSVENLSIAIWDILQQPIKELGIDLHCIKVQETENNSVEYFGD